MATSIAESLRRYAELPSLIYLLSEKCITLLSPNSWDDRNDARYLQLYREKKRLASVLALCMSQTDETYHHWRVFANGSSGVCVRFHRAKLLAAIKKRGGVIAKEVTYLSLQQIRNRKLNTAELPFLKRAAFIHEREFRLLYESKREAVDSLNVPIALDCIESITLSPWIHPNLSTHMKKIIHSIPDCDSLNIYRSTLIGNAEWQKLGEAAA